MRDRRDRSRADTATDPYLSEPLLDHDDPEDPLRIATIDDQQSNYDLALMHRNVRKIYAFTLFNFTGRSMWSQSILSAFIFLVRHENPESVGYATAVMGLSQIISSIPGRCLADRCGRGLILKAASLIGLGAIAATLCAVYYDQYYWLIGSLALWGIMWGLSDSALPSLFVDSIPDLQPSSYFRWGTIFMKFGNMLGPSGALAYFLYFGDDWSVKNCSIVITIGLIVCIPAILLLCCLRDFRLDSADNLPHEILLSNGDDDIEVNNDDEEDKDDCPRELRSSASDPAFLSATQEASSWMGMSSDLRNSPRLCCCKQSKAAPNLIAIADSLSCIASGLSIRYFPIFFIENLKLSPVMVQALYICAPLGQAIITKIGRLWAKRFGRCRVSVLFQWLFVALLASMIICYVKNMSVWFVCVFYVLHSSFLNSTGALTKSILVDVVPTQDHFKLRVTETFSMILWSGSSALGGYLVTSKGIIYTFCVAAALQLLASLPLLCLFSLDVRGTVGDEVFDSDNDLSSIAMLNSDDEGEAAFYEARRDRAESLGSDYFFDCNSVLPSDDEACMVRRSQVDTNRYARYIGRKCVYENGDPAYVPPGETADVVPPNYLAMCHNKRSKAQKMWQESQNWRFENDVWKIHTTSNRWFLKIREAYPHFIHGYCKQGFPVIYEQPGRMNLKELFREGCTITDMTTWYTFFMEYLSNCICAREEIRSKMGIDPTTPHKSSNYGFIVVLDMENAGISLLDRNVLKYLKVAGEMNGSHYPTSMRQTLVVNIAPIFAAAASGVTALLPDSVRVDVFSPKQVKTSLRKYIDADQIPPEYGGTSPYSLGCHPYDIELRRLVNEAANEGDMDSSRSSSDDVSPGSSIQAATSASSESGCRDEEASDTNTYEGQH